MYGNLEHVSREEGGIGAFLKLRAILHPVDKAPVRRKVSDTEDSYTQSELHPRKLHPFDMSNYSEECSHRVRFYFVHAI